MPLVEYRQHENNTIGAKEFEKRRPSRKKIMIVFPLKKVITWLKSRIRLLSLKPALEVFEFEEFMSLVFIHDETTKWISPKGLLQVSKVILGIAVQVYLNFSLEHSLLIACKLFSLIFPQSSAFSWSRTHCSAKSRAVIPISNSFS